MMLGQKLALLMTNAANSKDIASILTDARVAPWYTAAANLLFGFFKWTAAF